MKNKPLINQANLHKISKSQQFLIRGKSSAARTHPLKSNKHIDHETSTSELQQSILLIESHHNQDTPLSRQDTDKILKVLLSFKSRSTVMQISGLQEQLQENPSIIFKNNESKYFPKNRIQLFEEKISPDKQAFDVKTKTPKLKLGKENSRSGVFFEIKIDKLQTKITELEQTNEEQKQNISQLKQELINLESMKLTLQSENIKLNLKHTEQQQELNLVIQQKKEIESQLTVQSEKIEKKIKEFDSEVFLLREMLQDREAQLVSLFQKQL